MWDSPVHLLIILLTVSVILINLVPIARILGRTGHSGWWSLLIFVPVVNWIALWVFAYVRWPSIDKVE